MGSRAKRNRVTVEWTIGDFTLEGASDSAAFNQRQLAPEQLSSNLFLEQNGPGQFNSGQFDHGQFDHGQFDHGQFDHGQFDHGQVSHGASSLRISRQQRKSRGPDKVASSFLTPSLGTRDGSQSEMLLIYDFARWLVIGMMAIVLVSANSPSPQVEERAAVTRAVKRSLATEDSAWRSGSEERFAQLLDEEAPAAWYRNWRKSWQMGQIHASSRPAIEESQLLSLYVRDGYAIAEVQVDRPPSNPWQISPVIETRFYRHPTTSVNQNTASSGDAANDTGENIAANLEPQTVLLDETTAWIRTAPNASFWGEELQLETAHLRFDYYQRDAEVIEAAAPLLESIYVDLFRILGAPEPPTSPKLNLVLIQSIDPKWEAPGHVIEMVSPTLMPRPTTLTPTESFIDTVFTRLSFRAMAQAIPGTRRYWDSIGVGIRSWLRTELVEFPSPWHDQTDALYYETLRLNLPLTALDIDDGRRFDMPMNDTLVWQYRVAQSMIEYTVRRNGPGGLPRLMEGFTQFRRWDDLIPYVYNMSAQEWEVEWNEYLRRNLKLWHESTSTARLDPPANKQPLSSEQ